MSPKVSIVMPVLNGERYIREAIRSIQAQTYKNFELLVVDDGSTDGTRAEVDRFRDKLDVKYIAHQERQGIARSMNDGVRHASGDLIGFLDHDDTWFPSFLEVQVGYLEQHPEVAMVHSDFQTIDASGQILEESVALARERKRPSGNVFRELFMDSFIVGNSVLIRKECFTRLGLFDEGLRWGDYQMWLRIAHVYRVDYVPQVLARYRQHATQSTRNVTVSVPDEDSVPMQAIKRLLGQYPEIAEELGKRTIRRRMASLYFDMAYTWLMAGASRNARICLVRAIRQWPADWRLYVTYAAAILTPRYFRPARKVWRAVRRIFAGPPHSGSTVAGQARP